MAKTTQSIGNNLIDPTNYSQGGGVKDGKLTFENIPEDWVMYVQLYVKPRNRSVLLKENDGRVIASDYQEYLVAEIPYYKQNIDKNQTGTIIPYDIQTTEYTDLFGAQGLPMNEFGTPTTLGQESSFGITNIEINFDNVRQPQIEINFVDVRGQGLAAYGPTMGVNKSPYSWFFLMPYPEFCLKVKGFYGKTVSFPCLLTNFNMKYNNSTGNFDITTKFIGYPFSVLNDISIKVIEKLCCIPGGTEELENVYNNLVSCLQKSDSLDDKIILQEMPRIEDLCIKDYLAAIEQNKINNPIGDAYDQATKSPSLLVDEYNKIIDSVNELITLSRDITNEKTSELFNRYKILLLQGCLLGFKFKTLFNSPSNPRAKPINEFNTPGLGGTDNSNKDVFIDKKKNVVFSIENFSDYIKFNNIETSKFDTITLETSNAYYDSCATEGNIAGSKTFFNATNNVLKNITNNSDTLLKEIDASITKEAFIEALNSGSDVMNGVTKALLMIRGQYQERLNYLSNYQIYICNYFQNLEKKIKKEYGQVYRTRPTIQRLVTLISINVEAFLNLVLKTSIKAEKYHENNKESAIYASYFTDANNQQWVNRRGSNNTSNLPLRDVKLYAWPKTYKHGSDGSKEEVFPTEINANFSEWPEVILTKQIIDAIASNECKHKTLQASTSSNTGKWSALNIFEDAPFTKLEPLNSTIKLDSPYNNELFVRYFASNNQSTTESGVKEEKLKQLIVSRALINLLYFNRLFEQYPEGSTEKRLFDENVAALAEIEAKNLISTLESGDLIELIDSVFGGGVSSNGNGANILMDYAKTTNALTFSTGLTYQADSNLNLPYSSMFYLGNNTTKVIVTDGVNTYQRYGTTNENFSEIITNNYYGLSFADVPQYPYFRYITIYLNNPTTIISGFEYDERYKTDNLSFISTNQDIIYNYCPWYSDPTLNITANPPLNIPTSTITNPWLSRNIVYDKTRIEKIVTYEPFLNPSHIRDIKAVNLINDSSLPIENEKANIENLKTGYGDPSTFFMFNYLQPITKPQIDAFSGNSRSVVNNNATIQQGNGILSFKTYKYDDEQGYINISQPINFYESDKTYYYGYDPLLKILGQTIRKYHTTYNHYNSDTLKSFLWDPYKTKIGNNVVKLGTQEKSAYNIAANLNNSELLSYATTNPFGDIDIKKSSEPFINEYSIGSNWENHSYNSNTGFQNTIFYSYPYNIVHKNLNNKEFLIFNSFAEEKSPSLIQYLFIGDKKNETAIPSNSKWLKDFGTTEALGIDYNLNPFTIKDIFDNEPFTNNTQYFHNYSELISKSNLGLASHSFYDIPVDMNSTWFRAKMREYNKDITPVKKYNTTYMKKLSYLIWKEATMRILSMCEINLNNGVNGISGGQYYTDNVDDYVSVYLLDDKTTQPGGPTTTTEESLFTITYPQSKFYNRNIDSENQYKFYGFKSDNTGTYSIGTISSETFNGTIPGPNGTNQFYPNDNPTDACSPMLTQPPLLTLPTTSYINTSLVTPEPKWTRLFIHQTEWWKNMTTDARLTVDDSIDEQKIMKTYLTLMSLWGANAMDALIYNYPLTAPASGLFRVNNIDLVTLGAHLWSIENKLNNGSDFVYDIIQSHMNFSCPIINNPLFSLQFGDPNTGFPFNVYLKDTSVQLKTIDRYYDYGVICVPHSTNITKHGETILTNGTDGTSRQIWQMVWTADSAKPIYDITVQMISQSVKRDLINHFLQFVETSEFSRNIDDNLNALSMLREVAELALKTVEDGDGSDLSYHKFPFDIEQTLLMWADWASIVDLNNATTNFKSYYDADDGWRVKRSEQRTILSSKLFDVLTRELSDNQLDNPFKEIKTTTINSDTYYYSPWIRINDTIESPLCLKGDIGKKILLKLLKVITLEESEPYTDNPIIIKQSNKYETLLNYKQKVYGKTMPGNDQNYFFEYLFKGFYFPTIYGGMKTTDDFDYDYNSLGSNKLFFTRSWKEIEYPNVSDTAGATTILNNIQTSDALQTYFNAFINVITPNIKNNNANYEKPKTESINNPDTTTVDQNYTVDLGASSLLMYRTLKNLFNRWLAGTTMEDHTYKRSGCNQLIGGESTCRSLVQNIYIVDRVNRPAGHMVCGNPNQFASFFNQNQDKSVAGFLQDYVTSTSGGIGGFFIEYPTFFNFGSYGLNLDNNPGEALWGKHLTVDEKYGGPAIVIYVQNPEAKADAHEILMNYVNETSNNVVSTLPVDFWEPDSRGVIFKVDPTNENNSIFTNIQIDSETFKDTFEHIQIMGDMGREISSGNPKFLDQNLYNLWTVRSFMVSLECYGNMLIQQGMYFYLDHIPIFGGTYIIKKVSHSITPHNIKTKFWGSRVNQIPFPYADKDPLGSYYRCDNTTLNATPTVIDDDPGYCKETMVRTLKAFSDEVYKVLGVRPLVYTSDDFLTSLGFTENDSREFYNNYNVVINKTGNNKPFDNITAISLTNDEFTDEFISEVLPTPMPLSDITSAGSEYFINSSDNLVTESLNANVVYPLANAVVSSHSAKYGSRQNHCGIDLLPPVNVPYDKREGTPIFCVADGIIKYLKTPICTSDICPNAPGGNYIDIEHTLPNGEKYISRYLHLRKGIPYASGLSVGLPVTKGQIIGYMGKTHNIACGVHLHFEWRKLQPGTQWQQGPCVSPEDIWKKWL